MHGSVTRLFSGRAKCATAPLCGAALPTANYSCKLKEKGVQRDFFDYFFSSCIISAILHQYHRVWPAAGKGGAGGLGRRFELC